MRKLVLLIVLAGIAVFAQAPAGTREASQAEKLSPPEDLSAPPGREAAKEPVKPTPRLPDGKVDFGGKGVWAPIWVLDWANPKWVDKKVEVPFTEWGAQKFKERRASESKDDPEGYCLPPGVPRYTGTPYPFQMIQLPDRMVILYEGAAHTYRVIFMDGRKHTDPDKLNPTWMGESIGHWEGNDILVVDSVGFNGRTWLDYVGHPATEDLHVIEKFRRPDFNTLSYEATIEDKQAYSKPWTTSFKIRFQPNWELLEYVCLENNKDLSHLNTQEPK